MRLNTKELLKTRMKAQRELYWVPYGYAALSLLALIFAIVIVVVNWK